MADISAVLQLLPETTDVHIVSVRNECKELLFVLGKTPVCQPVRLHTVNFTTSSEQYFSFFADEEKEAHPRYTSQIGNYLYEPNSSVLKSRSLQTRCRPLRVGKTSSPQPPLHFRPTRPGISGTHVSSPGDTGLFRQATETYLPHHTQSKHRHPQFQTLRQRTPFQK